jgi:hypothetical protein
VDDVRAPVQRALFVFQVDISGERANRRNIAVDEAVQRTLEARLSTAGAVSRDEVLRPLLSRVMRNVIDLSASGAQ